LPLAPGDNADGVLQVCGWTTGFPMRTGFGRGYAEHDPWRFESARLVAAGEVDCALWISAYQETAPDWVETIPTIALAGPGWRPRRPPRVMIEVGRPGLDHDAVQHVAAIGGIAAITATKPSGAVPAARVLSDILSALPQSGG
jgi:formylmethanofuran dehydrogenase subunit B